MFLASGGMLAEAPKQKREDCAGVNADFYRGFAN
jgi:hypothetical protein